MGQVEQQLEELLALRGEVRLPSGVTIPFQGVRIRGSRAFVSGHASFRRRSSARAVRKVPREVPLEDAQALDRSATLAMLASLNGAVGDLDHVAAWLIVSGVTNADPDALRQRSS